LDLFCFYYVLNDLPQTVEVGQLVLFADDINLLIIERDEKVLQQKVNEMMKKLECWLQNNNLMINIEKTIAMSYHTMQNKFSMRPKITYNSKEIVYNLNTKFLGIHIEETLKWTTYLNTFRKQLCKVCYIIKSVEGMMGLSVIRSLYHSKFESLVRCGIIFWGVEKESISVFKLQKRVIRTMSGGGKSTSCRQLFKDCKILTVTLLYILEVLCFIKKYRMAVQKNEQINDQNTRRNMNLYVKPCNTNHYKKSVINIEIRLYNKVPNNIKNVEEYKPYERKLKSFLAEHAFYSLDEFLMS
jgi:hypothetical protein